MVILRFLFSKSQYLIYLGTSCFLRITFLKTNPQSGEFYVTLDKLPAKIESLDFRTPDFHWYFSLTICTCSCRALVCGQRWGSVERKPHNIMKKMWFPYLFPISLWPHITQLYFSLAAKGRPVHWVREIWLAVGHLGTRPSIFLICSKSSKYFYRVCFYFYITLFLIFNWSRIGTQCYISFSWATQ